MSGEITDDARRKVAELLNALGVPPALLRRGSITLHCDDKGIAQDVEVRFKRGLRAAPRGSSTGSTPSPCPGG